ncbi:MAG: type II secretion system F family protein [Lachnospiraceae bacterium]|nr:type II secretion system F family protein [Lachnospiraceae bacterium]
MANFKYRVVTPEGKSKTGSIPAGDRESAIELLRGGGNTVISVEEATRFDKSIDFSSFLKKGVSAREMGVFCRQFVTLSSSGVSIVRALTMLEEQAENASLKEALHEIRLSVEKGATLAESMHRQNRVFTPMFASLVGAGEEAGRLEVAFERMAIHYEKAEKLRGVVQKAMVYPVILALVSLAVIIIMLTRIVPMYAAMFEQMGTEMPAATRILVAVSGFFNRFWWLFVLLIVAAVMGFRSYAVTPAGRTRLDRLKLKLPVIGSLTRKTACAQFCRNLSTLLGAGMPIIRALGVTSETLGNELYRQCLKSAEDEVTRGSHLADPLTESGLFPPMICNMIRVGEETGTIDTMLEKSAEYYEEEVSSATESAAAALEPIIIIIMALVVIGIIAAVFSPMIALYTNIDAL